MGKTRARTKTLEIRISCKWICHHWWHRKMPLWQPPVPANTTKLASCQLTVFNEIHVHEYISCIRIYVQLNIIPFGYVYDISRTRYVQHLWNHIPTNYGKNAYFRVLITNTFLTNAQNWTSTFIKIQTLFRFSFPITFYHVIYFSIISMLPAFYICDVALPIHPETRAVEYLLID